MGSYYQPVSYLRGGKRKTRTKGGFIPSVMGGVVGAGRIMIPLALRQGYKLFNNKTKKRKSKTMRKINK
jgi:hypothetical protein